ncbi:Hypothetical protein CpMEX30_0317 [Corynebacterium pseudotuberculosis]|nr:hypothetical protein CP316_01545 [Corynebacterium pseudotuberculosis 316]AFH90131.2 hypothetical protein CP31_01765 [Corynebacterium pseudotuberculosis 31]AKS12639.1 Hypothetical protein CpE19_0297 [Corynebacterium pseudotuberculosis]AMN69380.2 hypothetical protein ATN02_01955 [Corynebacterium pseudotuberculosis]AMN74126.2 hypothetical protein ATN04_07075 [Corynebacterium pseudotuberculosis]
MKGSSVGRLILLLLLIAAIVLVWKAFGPKTWQKSAIPEPPRIKGPDDDEEFLWRLERDQFKKRRAAEEAKRKAAEQKKREATEDTSHGDREKSQDDETPSA